MRLMLTRPQMFTSNGHREEQEQRIALGATRDGRLTAIDHEKLSVTSPFDDWAEPATGVSSQLYACEHYRGVHRLIRGNTMTPTFTRGPGEALGVFDARDARWTSSRTRSASTRSSCGCATTRAVDPRGNPWSSDGLPECLRLGAERFGWAGRDPAPRAHARRRLADRHRAWPRPAYPIAFFMPEQRARARIHADGSAVVQTATQEFGTGVLTMATQVAADALGVDLEAMTFQAGDTRPARTARPRSARPARRWSSSAVHAAGTALRDQLVALAIADEGSPLHGVAPESVTVAGGRMTSPSGRAPARPTASCSPATTWPTPRRWAPGARRRSTRRTGC